MCSFDTHLFRLYLSSHSSFLSIFQQASNTNLVSGTQSEKFYGWMDDLAFYNRVLSTEEISKNWQKAVDTTDPSLFLYYNFDDGPDSAVIKNHGTIGSQADLYNGQGQWVIVMLYVILPNHTLLST